MQFKHYMKYLLLYLCLATILSCSGDNTGECALIEVERKEALFTTGGNQAAIDRINEQFDARKIEAGCN